jgi:hypothetical protein
MARPPLTCGNVKLLLAPLSVLMNLYRLLSTQAMQILVAEDKAGATQDL